MSAAKARFENAQGDLLASGQGILKILEARRDEATKIVGIISESGMIKGFRSVADQERVSAKNWQQLATWSMIALAVFAFFAFAESFYRPFTWAILSSRVFVALTVGLLIAYAARQADRHENAERQSRRQELELAALDPFLLPLPEADRNAVKKAMAEKMFGRREDPLTAPEPKEFSGSMLEVMKLLAESAKEAIQKR